jgi:anti-sigma B factor antagonist
VTTVDTDLPADAIGLRVTQRGAEAWVVTVTGDIDTVTASKLASVLTEQLSAARVVVVDLDGVEFISSAGLSVLFEAHEQAVREHRMLRLVCHSRVVNRALDVTALRAQFFFADTVSDALQNSPEVSLVSAEDGEDVDEV